MSAFHELSRRELQALCKQHGLPANKTNAAMAASLQTFFSEQQTISQAYAQVGTPCTVTRTRLAREKQQLEASTTSLAALILGKKPAGGLDPQVRKPAPVLLVDSPPALLLKTTPLRRRRSKKETLPVCDEDLGGHDSTENLRLSPEESSVLHMTNRKTSTPELQIPPHVLITDDQDSRLLPEEKKISSDPEPGLAPDVLVTDDQDPRRTREEEHLGLVVKDDVSPGSESAVASSSQANVDTLIQRATGMLEKFELWKAGSPGHFVQKHLAFDKENMYQQSPCKNLKLRSLQGHQMGTQSDRKEGILKEVRLLNVQT